MSMYRSKYNHYVSQLIEKTDTEVILKNKQNVADRVKFENFEANWGLSNDIRDYTDLITSIFREVLPKCIILSDTFTTTVYIDDGYIDYIKFNIINDKLRVKFSEALSYNFELDSVLYFELVNAYDIFNTIAGLFID